MLNIKQEEKRTEMARAGFVLFSLKFVVIWRADATTALQTEENSIQRDFNGRQPHRTCGAFLLFARLCLRHWKTGISRTVALYIQI